MPVAIKKCEFFIRKIDFIGFIIELGYISIDPKKVKAIGFATTIEGLLHSG